MAPIDGIINLDKPAGISSAQAVNRLKRLLPPKTKVGHAGTLDPFATGVLVILIGKATRLCEMVMNQPKAYQATVRLGGTTATDDPESAVVPTPGAVEIDAATVAEAVRKFIGPIMQRPPAFSAIKVGGRRAYKQARRGQIVELAERQVRIDDIRIDAYQWPDLKLTIECGRGAYIRAIARDLGAALGVGGYLTELRRIRVGEFFAAEAVTLDRLAEPGVLLASLRHL